MANIAENLQAIIKAKNDLKNSINAKNAGAITDSTPFSAYPNSISAIETRTLDMSDRVVSDSIELKDYTDSVFIASKCVKDVNIPTTVTSLGSSCFYYCTSLSAITIPDSVSTLFYNCFQYCTSLSEITIPDSVTSLGNNCFAYCSSLSSVIIGNSVTSLGDYCFSSCSSLSSVTIPDSVTSLGGWCFDSCSSLTSVTIGNSVTSIGSYCFGYCSKLTSVTCKAKTPPTLGSKVFNRTPSTMIIYVPAESVDAYKAATNWSNYADKIQAIA